VGEIYRDCYVEPRLPGAPELIATAPGAVANDVITPVLVEFLGAG
jgi:hypothetical protein